MIKTNDNLQLDAAINRTGRRTLEFDFPGLNIGTADYVDAETGCTVFHFEKRAKMVADCRGGAIGAIGTHYPLVDSICFAGGSAYGQEAILGAGAELHKRANYSTDWQDIALAAGAIIYDYRYRDNAVYPDKALGRAAIANAQPGRFEMGEVGAGFAASAGKCLWEKGYEGERTGQGAAFRQVGDVKVFFAVILNPFGAILDRQGEVVRGNLHPTTGHRIKLSDAVEDAANPQRGNTTVSLLVTNQKIERDMLKQVANQVHASMARAIDPFHTIFDGDVLFAVTTDEIDVPQLPPHALGAIGSDLAWDAILAVADAE